MKDNLIIQEYQPTQTNNSKEEFIMSTFMKEIEAKVAKVKAQTKELMKNYDQTNLGDDVYAEEVKADICNKLDCWAYSYDVWETLKKESWSKIHYDPSRRYEYGDI